MYHLIRYHDDGLQYSSSHSLRLASDFHHPRLEGPRIAGNVGHPPYGGSIGLNGISLQVALGLPVYRVLDSG